MVALYHELVEFRHWIMPLVASSMISKLAILNEKKKLKAIDSIPSLVVDVPFLSFPYEMNSIDGRNQYKIVNKFTIMK